MEDFFETHHFRRLRVYNIGIPFTYMRTGTWYTCSSFAVYHTHYLVYDTYFVHVQAPAPPPYLRTGSLYPGILALATCSSGLPLLNGYCSIFNVSYTAVYKYSINIQQSSWSSTSVTLRHLHA